MEKEYEIEFYDGLTVLFWSSPTDDDLVENQIEEARLHGYMLSDIEWLTATGRTRLVIKGEMTCIRHTVRH